MFETWKLLDARFSAMSLIELHAMHLALQQAGLKGQLLQVMHPRVATWFSWKLVAQNYWVWSLWSLVEAPQHRRTWVSSGCNMRTCRVLLGLIVYSRAVASPGEVSNILDPRIWSCFRPGIRECWFSSQSPPFFINYDWTKWGSFIWVCMVLD